MLKKKQVLALCAAGAAVFFIFRHIQLIYSKSKIQLELIQTKRQIGFLRGQTREQGLKIKQFAIEKAGLLEELEKADNQIGQLRIDQSEAEGHIYSLISEIQELEKENARILREKAGLREEIDSMRRENSLMDEKLSSIPKLKQEIRRLIRQGYPAAFNRKEKTETAGKRTETKIKGPDTQEGNAGFIIKDAVPTYKPRLKIEVRPQL